MFSGIGLNLLNPQILRYFIDTAQADGATKPLADSFSATHVMAPW